MTFQGGRKGREQGSHDAFLPFKFFVYGPSPLDQTGLVLIHADHEAIYAPFYRLRVMRARSTSFKC